MVKVLNQKEGKNWIMYHGDSITLLKGLPTDCTHFSLFSPPFESLFTYSDRERDMGNSSSTKEFQEHYQYLAKELYRITMPGRLMAVHCMNLPTTLTHNGYIGLRDFRGDLIRLHQATGFIFHSEITIWKDPLVQATRTKALALAHKQIVKDSAMCGMGLPDYIIVLRKPGQNPEPIPHVDGFTEYIGERKEPQEKKIKNQRHNKYSHKVWQRYASPVWMDIRQTNTLNVQQAREEADEKHVCPLQLDVIARCIELWTNPNDVILDPFTGIGSVGYQAIQMGRKFIGIELKQSYFRQALKYLSRAEHAPEKLL